jgi:hypothetical protein
MTITLLPNSFKKIGWVLLLPSTIAGIALAFSDFSLSLFHHKRYVVSDGLRDLFSFSDFTNTLVGSVIIIGALFVCFARQKHEDEFIAKLRLTSWQWAVGVNYILLLLAFLFVYGGAFLNVMLYNMFTILIIFILRFHYLLYKYSAPASDEK